MKALEKTLLIITMMIIGFCNNAYNQSHEQQVIELEKSVSQFIESQLKKPLLQSELSQFITTFNSHKQGDTCGHGPVFEAHTDEDQASILLQYRKEILRQQYFILNPEEKLVYRAPVSHLCENGGFESGDFTSYEGEYAQGMTGGYTGGECGAIPLSGNGDIDWNNSWMLPAPPVRFFKMVENGLDEIVDVHGGQELQMVHSGAYAARINSPGSDNHNCEPIYGINRLIKRVILEEAGLQSIAFHFAMVNQYPAHTGANPFFMARALGPDGAEQDRICIIANPQNNPFFNQFTPDPPLCGDYGDDIIIWKDWTCDSLNVIGNAGDTIQLEFIQTDCGYGAHFGYAYVDDICDTCSSIDSSGSITLNHLDPCQTLPFDVCGEFSLPYLNGQTGSINSLTLDILQDGGVVTTLTNPSYYGNTFCFTVNAGDMPPQTGGFDFSAHVVFDIAGGVTEDTDIHTNPGQNNDYIFDNPDCCQIEATVTDIICDDQGTSDVSDDTWSFDLNVENTALYGPLWEASDPVNVTGTYGQKTTIPMGLISNYNMTIDFKVSDVNDPDCFTNVIIDLPEPCSHECTLEAITSVSSCDDNGTPADTSDDYYEIILEVFGTQGESWMVLNSNMQVIYFGVGDENNVKLGYYPVDNGSEWFWVKLSNDPTCFVDVVVLAPTTCDFDCNIEALVTVGECDDNGTPHDTSDDFYYITVHVVGTNNLPWQLIGYPSGQTVSATGTANTTNIVLGPIDADAGSWPLYVNVTDPLYGDCYSQTLVHSPTCVDPNKSLNNVTITPNPNTGDMDIKAELESEGDFELSVYTIDGMLMARFNDLKSSGGAFSMNYQSNLPTGLYFFIFNIDGERIMKKVIIK